jgi:hypothetical protein
MSFSVLSKVSLGAKFEIEVDVLSYYQVADEGYNFSATSENQARSRLFWLMPVAMQMR